MKRFDSRDARRPGGRGRSHSDSFLSSHPREHGRGRAAHKAAQLCRQAMQALSLALANSAEDVLRELTVASVDPAPDASRLLVTVRCAASASSSFAQVGAGEVLARLNAASGWLRREVASSVTRKRAPELMFVLDAGGEVRP